jgi:hypothetical protein
MLAGCGGGEDCCTIDAKIMIDAPLGYPAMQHHFVVDKVSLPTTNTQARDFGLDLNGDATIDNQLGMVISTFAGMGFDVQGDMDKQVDTGGSMMLGDLGADDLTTEDIATFTIYQGANPMPPACATAQDTVCRRHLTGSGSFSIDATAPVDSPLVGAIAGGKLIAGPGHLTVRIVFLASIPFTITLLGARVELTSTATTTIGKLGGGVTKNDVDTKIIPGLQQGFVPIIARDCTMLTSPPGCGCVQDSTGKTLIGLFDTAPANCTISVDEIRNNSLIASLLAPDVTVEGMQALSLGISVHAVGATFTAP